MSTMQTLWDRLEAWAANNAPAMAEDLAPAATSAEIEELEAAVGIVLPAELRESLEIHNGENDGWPCKIFADRGAYLSTQRIAEQWNTCRENASQMDAMYDNDPDELMRDGVIDVEGPVRPVVFDPAWLPIMECNGDVFWALDFAPGDGGTRGQVIEVDWEGCSWKVVAPSFHALFDDYVNELESGAFRIDDGRPTKERLDSDYVPRTLQKFEEQPSHDHLARYYDVGDPIDLIVSAVPGFDEQDGRSGLTFKIHGGFVTLKGALATGDDSEDKPPHHFYKIKAKTAQRKPDLVLDVYKFEILESHDELSRYTT